MAATAPFCNVTVFAPPPGPVSPSGFRLLGPNATLAEVIAAINNNFSPKVQNSEFDRQLRNDIARPSPSKTGGESFNTRPSQTRRAAQDEISRINFIEQSVVRKRVKVMNPEDEEQYVIDSRVVALTMTDERTGAKWVFRDPNAERPMG